MIKLMKEDKEISSWLNFDKLTIAGHSFGGVTALEAAWFIPDIKFCVALDPYLYPIHKVLESGEKYQLPIPTITINT